MAKSKNKAPKKGAAKKSVKPAKSKKYTPAKGKKKVTKPEPAPSAPEPKKILVAEAPVIMPPPTSPVSASESPYPYPLPSTTPPPSTSPIASAPLQEKTVEEKKPRIIRITESIRIPQVDTLANRPASPFASQNPRSGAAPHPIKTPTGVSDLKTLATTVHKVLKNAPAFRPISGNDIQDLVKKTHADVKVTLKGRHVTLAQGSETEEFDY